MIKISRQTALEKCPLVSQAHLPISQECSGNSCHNYTGQPVTDSGNGGSDDAVQMVFVCALAWYLYL